MEKKSKWNEWWWGENQLPWTSAKIVIWGEKKENDASPGWARTTDGDADKYEIKFSVRINHNMKHWQKNKID